MPGIAEMIAITVAVTQFAKKALEKFKVDLKGTYAVILSIAASVCVVLYFVITTGTPFNLALISLVVQVAIGANAGYSLLKVARSK